MREPADDDKGPAAARGGRSILLLAAVGSICLGLGAAFASEAPDADEAGVVNPFLGDAQAIEQGRRIYRRKCIVCHQQTGGRAKNLFKTKLSDEKFLEVVINGREGTLMPVFGLRLSPDDVWKVHAYVKSSDHYY